MTDVVAEEIADLPDPRNDAFARTTLGFWIYLMSDCILFATLFATFAVMHQETFGGPRLGTLFSLPFALAETLVLLFSSFTSGFAMLAAMKSQRVKTIIWYIPTFLFGLSFVIMELIEFTRLVQDGHSWKNSASLSSFFTLVGTHGFHVSVGLLWMVVLMLQIFFKGITNITFKRMVCFSLFWHFLDLIWIFIFTFVYLAGAL